jgi:6-phosphogluconolactonase
MFSQLEDLEMDWTKTEIFQVDERVAPAGDDQRNLTHLIESLSIGAQGSIRPMPVTDDDLEAAADRYADSLPEALDLAHLGIGPDGHTASLVPGDPVLEVTDKRVAVTSGEYQGVRRMTLTYPELHRVRSLLWVITGEEKVDALQKLLARDPSVPAGRVDPGGDSLILADRAAAPGV